MNNSISLSLQLDCKCLKREKLCLSSSLHLQCFARDLGYYECSLGIGGGRNGQSVTFLWIKLQYNLKFFVPPTSNLTLLLQFPTEQLLCYSWGHPFSLYDHFPKTNVKWMWLFSADSVCSGSSVSAEVFVLDEIFVNYLTSEEE